MAKEGLTPQEITVLEQAAIKVFEEHGFATHNMLKKAAKACGLEGTASVIEANLAPVLDARPRTIASMKNLSKMPIAVTSVLPPREQDPNAASGGQEQKPQKNKLKAGEKDKEDERQGVKVFYLTERFSSEAEAKQAYLDFLAKPKATQQTEQTKKVPVTIRRKQARERAEQLRQQKEEEERRREEALPESRGRIALIAYRDGTSEKYMEEKKTRQAEAFAGDTFTTRELTDFSDTFANDAASVITGVGTNVILTQGITGQKKYFDDVRLDMYRVSRAMQYHAEEVASLIAAQSRDILTTKRGMTYNFQAPVQRYLVPLVREYLPETLAREEVAIEPSIEVFGGARVWSYPLEALERMVAMQKNPSPKPLYERLGEVLDDDFLYHAIFADVLTQIYFPGKPLRGEAGETAQNEFSLLARTFSTDQIKQFLAPYSLERAQADYDKARRHLNEVRPTQGRRASMDVIRQAEKAVADAEIILKGRLGYQEKTAQRKTAWINETVWVRLPKDPPKPEDYEGGVVSRAYQTAQKRYQSAKGEKVLAPNPEDYTNGKEADAYRLEASLFHLALTLAKFGERIK